MGSKPTGVALGPQARVPAPLRWALLGAAMLAAVACIALDVGPPAWFETHTVRWFSVRVPLLSWLVGMLVFLLPTAALVMVLGTALARRSPSLSSPTVSVESNESLGRFALFVLFALGALLTLLAALPSLAMLEAETGTRLTFNDGQRPASGSFVTLDFSADTRCRIDLHRFGRGTYNTRQRWQPSPATESGQAIYVLRYVERQPGRGPGRLEVAGDTGYLAGPVPRSIRIELERLGCPVLPDARLVIASPGPPLPWLRLTLFGTLLVALLIAALWCLRQR